MTSFQYLSLEVLPFMQKRTLIFGFSTQLNTGTIIFQIDYTDFFLPTNTSLK